MDNDIDKDTMELEHKINDLLVEYGAESLLKELGKVLVNLEGAGNAIYVGTIIKQLAEWEW